MIPTKRCFRCEKYKAFNQFSKQKTGKFGLFTYCKPCQNLIRGQAYAENKERENRNSREYKAAHKSEISEYNKKYSTENSEILTANRKVYRSKNKDKHCAHENSRRATKLNAQPKWLTKEQLLEIQSIYKKAKDLEAETGIKYHVDHIVPLRGKNVCGLHTPWNLQVITAEENLSKSNKLLAV